MSVIKRLSVNESRSGMRCEWLLCDSRHTRRRKVDAALWLRSRAEFNYVMRYYSDDPNYPFGLLLAWAPWVPEGEVQFV